MVEGSDEGWKGRLVPWELRAYSSHPPPRIPVHRKTDIFLPGLSGGIIKEKGRVAAGYATAGYKVWEFVCRVTLSRDTGLMGAQGADALYNLGHVLYRGVWDQVQVQSLILEDKEEHRSGSFRVGLLCPSGLLISAVSQVSIKKLRSRDQCIPSTTTADDTTLFQTSLPRTTRISDPYPRSSPTRFHMRKRISRKRRYLLYHHAHGYRSPS